MCNVYVCLVSFAILNPIFKIPEKFRILLNKYELHYDSWDNPSVHWT